MTEITEYEMVLKKVNNYTKKVSVKSLAFLFLEIHEEFVLNFDPVHFAIVRFYLTAPLIFD